MGQWNTSEYLKTHKVVCEDCKHNQRDSCVDCAELFEKTVSPKIVSATALLTEAISKQNWIERSNKFRVDDIVVITHGKWKDKVGKLEKTLMLKNPKTGKTMKKWGIQLLDGTKGGKKGKVAMLPTHLRFASQ